MTTPIHCITTPIHSIDNSVQPRINHTYNVQPWLHGMGLQLALSRAILHTLLTASVLFVGCGSHRVMSFNYTKSAVDVRNVAMTLRPGESIETAISRLSSLIYSKKMAAHT